MPTHSVRVWKDNERECVDVNIIADDFYVLNFPGPEGQMLLERVAQICFEAMEEAKKVAQ